MSQDLNRPNSSRSDEEQTEDPTANAVRKRKETEQNEHHSQEQAHNLLRRAEGERLLPPDQLHHLSPASLVGKLIERSVL